MNEFEAMETAQKKYDNELKKLKSLSIKNTEVKKEEHNKMMEEQALRQDKLVKELNQDREINSLKEKNKELEKYTTFQNDMILDLLNRLMKEKNKE